MNHLLQSITTALSLPFSLVQMEKKQSTTPLTYPSHRINNAGSDETAPLPHAARLEEQLSSLNWGSAFSASSASFTNIGSVLPGAASDSTKSALGDSGLAGDSFTLSIATLLTAVQVPSGVGISHRCGPIARLKCAFEEICLV